MKRMITLLATAGCLLFATSCNKDNDKKQFATNKAGERLVEKVEAVRYAHDTNYYSYLFTYNNDGSLKSFTHYWNNDYYYTVSFEKKDNTLHMTQTDYDGETNAIDGESSTSFDLNKYGFIVLDRGWEGTDNYRLSYDESGRYLHNVFDGDELIWTFEWEDGNIADEKIAFIRQSHPSNIDWSAFLQAWRTEDNEALVALPSTCEFWGFSEGYLGNKCQGLPIESDDCKYTYDFNEDGFVSSILKTSSWYTTINTITYKNK
ncbi:MAG: hypothetical protein NC396_05115 [Bacteroides sp.]|nr:hypothetical protein [Bacteroides sp.]MCM1085739.1 hypothetical protein [Bacteroides sp.]